MERLLIGDWWADRTTNELGRGGETVRIEPKAMEVLMVLAQHAGEVISREKLLADVWAGVVVGDEALTQSIIKLRRAFGDNPRAPAYIETISKRGYRLIARVGSAAPAEAAAAPTRRRGRWAAVAAAVVLALGAAAAYFGQSVLPVPSAAPDAEPLTLTVLPFETVGPGVEQNHLARGISSDLMTDLSSLSGLRLITAPTGARYVVSGSVQREGETLRINIRLADVRTGEQVWSQRVERPFGDLFAIQSEITHSVMQHLPGKISDAERRRLAKRHTDSLEAYDYFLRGQAKFLVRRTEENRQARAFYAKALELDPKFARAYAGLAMTHAMDYRYQGAAAPSGELDRALELAESARLIDPEIPEVYWALGFVHTQSRRHQQAIQALQKAIELNRSYADAYALMGGIYTYVGEPARSIPLLRTALRLNPDGGYLYYLLLGRAYLFENDAQQALINLREALARNPDDVETRVYLAAALVAGGDRPAAEWEADLIRAYEQGFSAQHWLKTYPMTSAPLQQRLSKLLAELQL
jgi:DNA-binding winged helix-turn-helix (wHTH) protein/TolB-like protein/Tfp pilus assembly protein PilF